MTRTLFFPFRGLAIGANHKNQKVQYVFDHAISSPNMLWQS